MEPDPGAESEPSATDLDRQAAVRRIQQALADDVLEFAQLDRRFELVFAAETPSDMDQAVGDLPVLRESSANPKLRHPVASKHFKLIGDTQIGGEVALGANLRVTNIVGDTVVDLSSAEIPPGGVTLELRSFVGDVRVIVADGTRVQHESTALIGDEKSQLVPPVFEPVVRVKVLTVVGDSSLYSLSQVPEGKLRQLWRKLRTAPELPPQR